MSLTRRLQVLLDEERYARLERRSEETGASVGALVRRAIDETYPAGSSDPERAGEEFLAADPMPVEDWPTMKEELLRSMYDGRAPGA
jgi:Ribbon-helix-helix protein, copG family